MNTESKSHYFAAALRIADVHFFIGSVVFFTLASRALAVVIGFQIYQITHNPLFLGWLGLVEAVPVLSLVLFGGYVADHFNRRKIILITRAASCLCAVALVLLSLKIHTASLLGLYAVVFLAPESHAGLPIPPIRPLRHRWSPNI